MDAFTDEQEAIDYIMEKTAPWRAEHPPIERDNWKLCEYWFVKDQGTKLKHEAKCEDLMERSGAEATSAVQALGLEEGNGPSKKRKVSPEEKHKQLISKLSGGLQRLARHLSTLDQQLPVVRRQISKEQFSKLRDGMMACRTCREECLDAYVDLKQFQPSLTEQEQEDEEKKISECTAKVAAHCEALNDAIKAYLKPAGPASSANPSSKALADPALKQEKELQEQQQQQQEHESDLAHDEEGDQGPE